MEPMSPIGDGLEKTGKEEVEGGGIGESEENAETALALTLRGGEGGR